MNAERSHSGKIALTRTPPEALVVHCSDYRFQAAIQEFLYQGLSLHSYDLLAIPGGAHFASTGAMLPKHHAVGKQSLTFLIEFHQLKRLIFIDHADCVFFKNRLAFFFPDPSFNEKQIANLRKAMGVVRDWFPLVAVDAYLAEAQVDHSVSFTRIA
jgi:hypothetical protein